MIARNPKFLWRCGMLGLIGLLAASGCATSMTYSTHPQTLEPGEVQAGGALQLALNTNVKSEVDEVVDSAESRIKSMNGADMSDEEFRELFDAVVAIALFKPALDMEAAMRVGVIEGVDVGVRYSSATLKGDVKVRLWQSGDEKHVVSVMGGVGYQGSAGPSIITYISWQEFSRLDADISVMYGYDHSDYFRAYVGPRAIRSWLSVTPKLDPKLRDAIPQQYDDYRPDQYFQDENLLYLGATGGVMVGYKWVWVHLEATAMYTFFEPTILGRSRNLSGLALVPVAGLTFEF